MVKSVNCLNKLIFNYLGESNTAILLAYTNLYLKESVNDGVLWVQINEDDHTTAIVATGENGKCLCFAKEDADFNELGFIINDKFTSPDILQSEQIDKKYLLCKNLDSVIGMNGIDYKRFAEINALDGSKNSDNKALVELKMFFNLKGICQGQLISEQDVNISGGFITFSDDFAVITDVFTKEEYRGRGYGRRLVEKLLNCSTKEKVYLTSKEHNLPFYKKLGFNVVKEIYEYKKDF